MILVVGATGSLGGRIVRGLLEQGKAVRVFVRQNSPSEQMAQQGLAHTIQSLLDAGAPPAWGDLKDRASIEAAVAGWTRSSRPPTLSSAAARTPWRRSICRGR